MRKLFAAILAIAMLFSLCACGNKDVEEVERDCGVYITVQAADVFTVSCGTIEGSDAYKNEDGSVIAPGTVIHFDFAGGAAEGSEEAIIDYSICAYDESLGIIADNSFSDDFANKARYDIVITEDHHILYDGEEYSCGGDMIVTYENTAPADGVSLMVPTVSIPSRPEVADKINSAIEGYNATFTGEMYTANKDAYGKDNPDNASLEPFSMSRTVRVIRGDSKVLSFRMADRANLGTKTTLAITCHSFDPQTGDEISIDDLSADSAAFKDYCAERVLVATTEEERFLTESMIFVDGYTDNIRNLISDGHWYLSADGLMIAANPGDISVGYYEFTIPYEDLADYLKEEYLPAELSGDYGNASLQYAKDVTAESLSLIGAEPDDSIDSMIVTVAGNIYNVNVYTGKYSTDSGKFTPDLQVVYCSDMMRGAALAINRAPASTPDLMLSFTCPDGTVRQLLISTDSANGGLLLMDLQGGNEGVVVKSSTKYDLNGDGSEETVKIVSGDSVSVAVGKETVETPVKTEAVMRLYDLNGDGKMEIYVSGKLESGESATCCYTYDKSLAALGEPIDGIVNEFNGNRLFVLGEIDVLGVHPVNLVYYYDFSANQLVQMTGFEYIFDGEEMLTAAVAMAMKDGTAINAGTGVYLKSTDGESYVKVTTSDGKSGTLSITKDAMGQWTINGQPVSLCFKELAQ